MTAPSVTESALLRQAFSSFPSGVVALCAQVDGMPVGMAASSFTSVSLEPALVSVCVASTSTTWPVLRNHGRVGVSVLAEHHGEICRNLAAKTGDRFAGVTWSATEHGSVFLDDAVLRLDCTIAQEVSAGDHEIVVLQVNDLSHEPARAPLVFHGSRFHRLAQG